MDLIEIGKIVSRVYNLNNQRDRILSAAAIRELRDIFARMQAEYDAGIWFIPKGSSLRTTFVAAALCTNAGGEIHDAL
ncbi:MAG: hypothetical protein JWM42_1857 [Burkholderia sp.]|nr:hypothetical protein [Burkholderia sp.]